MPERVILLGRKGAGVTEIAADLCISRQTVYDWCDEKSKQYHRPFAQAMEIAGELAEAWWMRIGRLTVAGGVRRSAPPSWWIFNMKNRFGWKDRVDIGSSKESPLRIVKKVYHIEGDEPTDDDADAQSGDV